MQNLMVHLSANSSHQLLASYFSPLHLSESGQAPHTLFAPVDPVSFAGAGRAGKKMPAGLAARAEIQCSENVWRRQCHYSSNNAAVQYRRTTVSICPCRRYVRVRSVSVKVLPEP
jgi:hypothetical protein